MVARLVIGLEIFRGVIVRAMGIARDVVDGASACFRYVSHTRFEVWIGDLGTNTVGYLKQ